MKMSYHWFESKLNRTIDAILEGIEEKAPILATQLLSDRSRWSGKDKYTPEETTNFILSLRAWDPTRNQAKFVVYIVRQLANNYLTAEPNNIEDLDRIAKALTYFNTKSKSAQWPHPRDINQFTNWRKLEDISEKDDTTYQSKRQQKREIVSGSESLGTVVVPNQYQTTYALHRIIEPEAAIILGMGTRWCTSGLAVQAYVDHKMTEYTKENPPIIKYPAWHTRSGEERPLQFMKFGTQQGFPLMAAQYMGMRETILDNGPLYVITQLDDGPKPKDIGRSKQICQFTQSMEQFKNTHDREIQTVCAPLYYAMTKWVGAEPNINRILKRIHTDDNLDNIQNSVGFVIKPEVRLNEKIELEVTHRGYPDDYEYKMFDTDVVFTWKARRLPPPPQGIPDIWLEWYKGILHYEDIEVARTHTGPREYPPLTEWILNCQDRLEEALILDVLKIAAAVNAPIDYDMVYEQIIEGFEDQKADYDRRYGPSPNRDDVQPGRGSRLKYCNLKWVPILYEFLSTFIGEIEEVWDEVRENGPPE